MTTTDHSLGIRSAAARRGLTTDAYLAIVNAGLKWCRACQDWRPLADYKPSTSTRDGVRPTCIRPYTPKPHVPITHGRVTGYSRGCRCPECRQANTDSLNRRKAERCADPAAADRAGHGKTSTYLNYGCRCDPCKAAQSVTNRRNYQRRKQMTETAT